MLVWSLIGFIMFLSVFIFAMFLKNQTLQDIIEQLETDMLFYKKLQDTDESKRVGRDKATGRFVSVKELN